ncbi:MAG: hypothetical protein JNJ82_09455 [Opitutaceae bacterium]|nr:hypothetical protein [Opitutaceae bacterium]
MGRSCRRLLIGLLAPLALGAAEGFDAEAFSPTNWPGKAPEAVVRAARPLMQDLLVAMRAQSTSDQRLARDRLVAALGRYAGVPEERPVYGQPIDPTPPDRQRLESVWRAALVAQDGRRGWEQARQREVAPGEGGKVPRLRVSERQIRALLQTHEAGLDPDGEFLRRAREGLDYLLSTQSTGGVFGFPYDPGGPGLRKAAAAVVERGRSRGQTLVERGWVIDDLGEGGLNFDHGMCGALMIHGYAVTGEPRYLDAAVRAGQWARGRPLGPNFNYNGFLGVLLARLYRATGDASWLEAARVVFEHGVLPGQLPNGRWLDQHNAKIQYHAILCAQLGEYLLALRFAQDPSAGRVEQCLRRGLDNLAAEIATYGTNNAEEALSLLALSFGSRVVEPAPAWKQATSVAVNYVTGPLAERLRSRGGGLPEPVAAWVLWSRPSGPGEETVELRSPLRPPDRSSP